MTKTALIEETMAEGKYFEYGLIIRKARTDLGLTQAEMGERVGMTTGSLCNIEMGRVNVTLETLRKIAAATGKKLRISFD